MRNVPLLLGLVVLFVSCAPDGKVQADERIVDMSMAWDSLRGSAGFYSELEQYVGDIHSFFPQIPAERIRSLEKIASYVQTVNESGEVAVLNFICTHNSRRSHMSQIWASAAAHWYGLGENVITYSGGTEVTAFNPRAIAALERAGFLIETPGGENPRYKVSFSNNGKVLECFSKVYGDPFNAAPHFAAIMTCSEADQHCPIIPNADVRIPITYEDPKVSDGTERESAAYDERCRQIAIEMFFLMSKVGSSR